MVHLRKWLWFGFVIGVLTAAVLAASSQAVAQREVPDPWTLKERLFAEAGFETLPLPSGGARPVAADVVDATAAEVATDVPSWSRIAFTSARDGNLEIYLAKGDGTEVTRLTYHEASDFLPRLRRGADVVAFVSRRDGGRDIYRVNSDGTNLQRLTDSPGDAMWPDWSPDGTALLFASNQHGSWEIYRMAADGSNQVRLTHNNADDISPVWSPDGGSIAWIRGVGSERAIWLMDADGQNQRRLAGDWPYLQNLTWSPEGNWLAFDADVDRDWSNEIARVDPVTGSLAIVYDAGEWPLDFWMGSWSPDGQWLLFSRVEYRVEDYEGDYLVVDRIYVERIPWNGGPVQRVFDSGIDVQSHWQTTDATPPEVWLTPLPRYVRSSNGGFYVSWSGDEVGPAGLLRYELQAKRGSDSEWREVLRAPATQLYVLGQLGETYSFRVRAVDKAFNVSDWSGDNRHVATPYLWSVVGRVVDSRGVPLENAVVVADPPGLGPSNSGADGGFALYFANRDSRRITAEKTGYGQTAATTFAQDVSNRWWALGPSTNALTNGSFEENDWQPWQLGGSIPPIHDRSAYHTGIASALLHAAPPVSVMTLSQNPDDPGSHGPPKVVADSAGRLHALWREGDGWVYTTRAPGGAWTRPAQQPPVGAHPDMVVGADGTVHLVSVHTSHEGGRPAYLWIGYTARPLDGDWTPVLNISGRFPTVEYPSFVSPPVITQDSRGGLYVAWTPRTGVWLIEKPAGQGWLPAEVVSSYGRDPIPVAGGDGGLHLFWLYFIDADRAGLVECWRPLGGTWLAPRGVPTGDFNPIRRSFAADGLGRLHMVLFSRDFTKIGYAQKSASDAWPQPVLALTLGPRYGTSLALAASDDGHLHLTWESRDGSNLESKVHYSFRHRDGPWTYPLLVADAPVEGRAEAPDVAPGLGYSAHLIWRQRQSGQNTEIRSADINPTPRSSTLAQTTLLPADTHAATLSFAYQVAVAAHSSALFEARVNGTTVFSTSVPTEDWTLGWADVSPWAGQTVTVEFVSRSTEFSGPITVQLDDVTLGAWLTPVVRAVEPSLIPSGTATRLTLRGENFVPTPTVWLGDTQLGNVTWVDERTLHATVPASVKPGVHSFRVRNPSGHESNRPPLLKVGRPLYLPVVGTAR